MTCCWLTVDPTRRDEKQKLPRLQEEAQCSPRGVATEIRSMGCGLRSVNQPKATGLAIRKLCSTAKLDLGW